MFPSSPDDLRLSTDVAPSGRSTATLLFTLRFNGPEAASAHHGMGQEIVVAYGSGNIERTLVFTLNFLPEQRLFSMRKKVDNVMCEFSVLVNTDGLMHVAYNLSSTNYFPQDIAMTLYVGNEQLVQISKDTGHIPELNGDNRHKAARSDIVLRSPYGKADFARLFTLPWAFRVKVFEHL